MPTFLDAETPTGRNYYEHRRACSCNLIPETFSRLSDEEEWHHRRAVGQFLNELGSAPKAWREIVFGTIGRVLSFGCYLSGWYMPMYFAGRLEAANVREYEEAAFHARALGLSACESALLAMSVTEKEHENYFAGVVVNKRLTPLMKSIFGWGPMQNEVEKH